MAFRSPRIHLLYFFFPAGPLWAPRLKKRNINGLLVATVGSFLLICSSRQAREFILANSHLQSLRRRLRSGGSEAKLGGPWRGEGRGGNVKHLESQRCVRACVLMGELKRI